MPATAEKVLGPIVRETLENKVYGSLRKAIMGGVLAPGETITFRKLAEVFGTSMMPVRQAVNRLIAERALEIRPNRSVIVPEMTRRRFQDITQARVLVEGGAVYLSAGRMSPERLDRLEAINATILKCVSAGDVAGQLRANRDFHMSVYEASGSEILQQMIEGLWLQVGPFLHLTVDAPQIRWTTRHHVAMIQHLVRGDGEAARASIVADIQETAEKLLNHVEFACDGPKPAQK